MRRRPLWLLFVAALIAAMPARAASAQAVADVERKLLPYQNGALASLPREFWEGLSFVRSQEERLRALKADIQFGLSGDEAEGRSLFKLNTGISLSRGVFPSELTVNTRLGLQLRDGQLQEDVTSMQITYDYHTTNLVEYFAFAERFSDSFLSIQQRYEIGFGARIGAEFGRVGNWQDVNAHIANVEAGLPAIRSAIPQAADRAGRSIVTTADLDALQKAIHNLDYSLRDEQARFLIGMVASVFAEIERAELDLPFVPIASPGDPPSRLKVTLDSEQRYRLTLRPTIRFHPTPEIHITIYPYFKLPLDGPRYAETPGGRKLDYRRDILAELAWSLRQNQTGLENVDFVLVFNHFYDNAPPKLPASYLDAAELLGRRFLVTEAAHSHRVVALVLRLRW